MGRIKSPSEPAIGDIVIKDDTLRGCWKIGKIMSLFKSRDGQTRSASVKLSSPSKVINRPLNLLYPIEVSNSDREKSTEKSNGDQERNVKENKKMSISATRQSSARTSALRVRQLIKEQSCICIQKQFSVFVFKSKISEILYISAYNVDAFIFLVTI